MGGKKHCASVCFVFRFDAVKYLSHPIVFSITLLFGYSVRYEKLVMSATIDYNRFICKKKQTNNISTLQCCVYIWDCSRAVKDVLFLGNVESEDTAYI